MNKRKVAIITVSVLVFTGLFSNMALSTNDPLITESYLNNVFMPKVQEYINANKPGSYKVVSVSKGQQFVGNEGCEFILRQGGGIIIASNLGGLTDTTVGTDLGADTALPSNHLLIVPRSDGRGFKATSDVLVMVKGDYTIK